MAQADACARKRFKSEAGDSDGVGCSGGMLSINRVLLTKLLKGSAYVCIGLLA